MTEQFRNTPDSTTTDYGEMFRDAQEFDFHLPDPHLEDAIKNAFGDILIMKAVESEDVDSLRYRGSQIPAREIRAVHEKEYLQATNDYLDQCLVMAKQRDPKDIAYSYRGTGPSDVTFGKLSQDIQSFKENLVYINNAEFEKATDRMAERIIKDASAGLEVGVFSYADRSPEFIGVKVLDKVRRILESDSNYSPEESRMIANNIVFSDSATAVARNVATKNKDNARKGHLYVIDDFVVSGNRMRGGIRRLEQAIAETTVDASQIDIRGLAICAVPSDEENYEGQAFAVDAVYQPADGKPRTHNYMAGSWASTDYGYENKLDDFAKITGLTHPFSLKDGGPLSSHMIKGRYEKDERGNYIDPQYADERQQVIKKFGVASLH